jgi:hypothetical protein
MPKALRDFLEFLTIPDLEQVFIITIAEKNDTATERTDSIPHATHDYYSFFRLVMVMV